MAPTKTQTNKVYEYGSKVKILKVNGKIQINIGFWEDSKEYTASILGWHRNGNLLATCKDKQTLIDWVKNKYPDCNINE